MSAEEYSIHSSQSQVRLLNYHISVNINVVLICDGGVTSLETKLNSICLPVCGSC